MTVQQEFLRMAMAELAMTRAVFAQRIGCPVATLNKWLLPSASEQSRPMPETVWVLVREILEHEKLKAKVAVAKNSFESACAIPSGYI